MSSPSQFTTAVLLRIVLAYAAPNSKSLRRLARFRSPLHVFFDPERLSGDTFFKDRLNTKDSKMRKKRIGADWEIQGLLELVQAKMQEDGEPLSDADVAQACLYVDGIRSYYIFRIQKLFAGRKIRGISCRKKGIGRLNKLVDIAHFQLRGFTRKGQNRRD